MTPINDEHYLAQVYEGYETVLCRVCGTAVDIGIKTSLNEVCCTECNYPLDTDPEDMDIMFHQK